MSVPDFASVLLQFIEVRAAAENVEKNAEENFVQAAFR